MIGSILAAYTVFVFALSTTAFLTVFVGGNDPADVTQGAPVMRATWGVVYLLTFVSVIIRWRQVAAMLHANPWLVFLILLTFVSALWSIDPARTLHGAFLLLFTALYAIDLNIRFTLEKQLQFLCVACLLLVSLSIFVELAMPGFVPGPDFRDSAWHGVFKAKNTFGEVGMLGVAACLTSPLQSKLIRVLAIVGGVVVQVLAHSVGSMICLAAIVGLFVLLPILKWRPKARKIALIVTAGTALFAVCVAGLNFAQATAFTGHDTTMNRRSELWRTVACLHRRTTGSGIRIRRVLEQNVATCKTHPRGSSMGGCASLPQRLYRNCSWIGPGRLGSVQHGHSQNGAASVLVFHERSRKPEKVAADLPGNCLSAPIVGEQHS